MNHWLDEILHTDKNASYRRHDYTAATIATEHVNSKQDEWVQSASISEATRTIYILSANSNKEQAPSPIDVHDCMSKPDVFPPNHLNLWPLTLHLEI